MEVLKGIFRGSLIFFTLVFQNKTGEKSTPKNVLASLSKNSPAPIYTFHSTLLVPGIVGGHMIDAKTIGYEMLNAATDYINNGKFKSNYNTLKTFINYDSIIKYKINPDLIPKDAVVLNPPKHFLEKYFEIIISILLILVLIFITSILILLIKYKKTNHKLHEKTNEQATLLTLFDQGDSVLFKWKNDKHKSIEYVSKSVSKLLGYTQDEFLKNEILYINCIDKNDLQNVKNETKM